MKGTRGVYFEALAGIQPVFKLNPVASGMTKIFLILLFYNFSLAGTFQKSGYQFTTEKLCDGWPQAPVGSAAGYCLGFVAGHEDGLRMPRYAAQSREGVIYITDMYGWDWEKGTVWALWMDGGSARLVDLFPTKKMTMPNGIAIDPEGRVYLGTPTGIFRFLPRDPKTGAWNKDTNLELVDDFMSQSTFRKSEYQNAKSFNSMRRRMKNKHPLVQLAFNSDFSELYVNIGAPSDRCDSGLLTKNKDGLCTQAGSPFSQRSGLATSTF